MACALPNWALTEYLERDYVSAVKLGEYGVWSTLYAAIREETREAPWMQDFLRTARRPPLQYSPARLRIATGNQQRKARAAQGRTGIDGHATTVPGHNFLHYRKP